MAEETKLERTPPEAFVEWLFDYYGKAGWPSATIHWRIGSMMSIWQDDEIYQYWATNVALPEEDPTGIAKVAQQSAGDTGIDIPMLPINADGSPDIPEATRILSRLGSLDELAQVLDAWEGDVITEEEGKLIFDDTAPLVDPVAYFGKVYKLSTEKVQDLLDSKNDKELVDKLLKEDLDDRLRNELYKGFQYVRGNIGVFAEAREMSMAENVEVVARQEQVAYEGEVKRLQEEQKIAPLVARLQRDPASVEKLSEVKPLLDIFEKSPYQAGLGEDIYRRLSDISQQARRGELVSVLEAGEAMRADEFRRQRIQQLRQPTGTPQPSGASAFEKMLGGTNLAPGTKLRSFMESELARKAQSPGLAQERRDWWSGISESLWRSGKPQLGQKAIRTVRGQPDITPEELEEQGLRGGYADPIYGIERDPKKLRQQYFRRPGAGLVGRLQPSVRFR